MRAAQPFIAEAFHKAGQPVPALPGHHDAHLDDHDARGLKVAPGSGSQGAQLGHDPGKRSRERLDVVVGGGPSDRQPK